LINQDQRATAMLNHHNHRFFTGRMFFLLLSQQYESTEGNSKHWTQPVASPYLFFISHWTPDRRDLAALTRLSWRQYFC